VLSKRVVDGRCGLLPPMRKGSLVKEQAVVFLKTHQVNFRRLSLTFLSLALCVFAWGLQYKLSLYDPPQAVSHQVPQAKLLSKNEWSPTAVDSRGIDMTISPQVLVQQFFPWFFCLSLTFGLGHFLASRQKHFAMSRPWLARRSACLSAFFFRPPPPFALA
jgi:hypothetical protein